MSVPMDRPCILTCMPLGMQTILTHRTVYPKYRTTLCVAFVCDDHAQGKVLLTPQLISILWYSDGGVLGIITSCVVKFEDSIISVLH